MPRSVLIVEDEPLIAMMLEDYLGALGKTVIGPADSCAEALALIAQGGIDAAILDVNLRGGETSSPIADALAAAGIPFLFASGGASDGVDGPHADRPVLAKPFTMEAVSRGLSAII
ncbi:MULTISPECIES: response regulator [Sphingomonas]|uniref:response regulator n=1 Tax=Sphingomonas TaxID=13687 RepID=UPI00082F6030|nr:response regulator [Sphingomonas sp. CCH10-B3]MBA3878250.1 response regulator [Sphingobium sp.]